MITEFADRVQCMHVRGGRENRGFARDAQSKVLSIHIPLRLQTFGEVVSRSDYFFGYAADSIGAGANAS